MTAEPEPTGWELQRTMTQLRDDVSTGFARIEKSIEDVLKNALPRDVFEAREAIVVSRVKAVEEWQARADAEKTDGPRYWRQTVVFAVSALTSVGALLVAILH